MPSASHGNSAAAPVPVNLGKYDNNRRWNWFDALRNAEHGMSMAEGYLLSELVRRAGDGWTNQPYQRRVLASHDLDHVGVFVSWPSTATLAKVLGCSDKYVRTLSKRLQDRGYLTVLINAGGTGERARTDRPNLYVVDARSLPTGLVHRVEPEVRGGAPIGAPGWNQRCAGVEPEVHQIVSEESVNTNSLNVAEYGQREMASVKADEMPEQMTLELTTAIRAICPQDDLRTAQSNARNLASLGATPDLVRQFPSWWANTGKTYTYGSAAIVKWWTAFAAAHSTDSHKPTASTTPRPACAIQDCVDGWIPRMDSATSDPCPTCRPNWTTPATKPEPAITVPAASPAGLEGVKNALRQARAKEAAIV
jgi:hypothetical protein